MSTPTQDRATFVPNSRNESEIQSLADFLAESPRTTEHLAPCLVSRKGEKQEIPPEVFDMLTLVVAALSEGRGVSVVPTNAQLTTQQAADHLGMSRPTLVKLLEHGEIPFRKVGRHRRVGLQDLIDYEERTKSERQRTLSELTAEASAGGHYFTSPKTTKTR